MKYKAVPVAKFWKLAHTTRSDLFGKAFLLREDDGGNLVRDFGYAMTREHDGKVYNWFDHYRQGGHHDHSKIKFVIINTSPTND
jgi:hypothetical protein